MWKTLLSRLGLFKEIFSSNGGSKEVKKEEKKIKSILSQGRKDGVGIRRRVAITEPERNSQGELIDVDESCSS